MDNLSNAASNLENQAQAVHKMETVQMDEHMKAMWAGQSNVLVAVRVRPIMNHDRSQKSCVRVLDSKVVVIMDPQHDKGDILRANRSREKQYAFDYAFEPRSSQEATYHHTTKFLIHGVLDGFSATVFAYGQTGSGKTHTMIGTHKNPGIMVRVMSDLFKYSASQASKLRLGVYFKVTVNFLEVYNENIRDLLGENNNPDEYLDLREDPIKGAVVAGITEVEVHNSDEIMQLLHRGNAKRSQAATAANEVSSRSHAVLQVAVDSRDRAPGVADSIKVGKLSLIDLAGSERAANTQNRGARLVEGANINRSLLALGNCINALDTSKGKGTFVPYRDSKLTRLLKDSLGGNCRTIMIANISPAASSFEETLNTLKYANRAKNIKTTVKRNVLNVNYHISEYVDLINNLRSEIQVLKGQMEEGPVQGPGANVSEESSESVTSNGSKQNLNGNFAAPMLAGGENQVHSDQPINQNGFNADPSRNLTTPSDAIRSNLRSAGQSRGRMGTSTTGKDRELVNSMRQMVVSNFQERMQLRRSLIELEDQNVQNSIEISKRELMVVNWTEHNPNGKGIMGEDGKPLPQSSAEFGSHIIANATNEVASAWRECEQLRNSVMKNNSMKRSIAKRLRHNEREAQRVRDDLGNKITGEDRRELMELQYQVGRLELENMELEQHRIVHESILKGKDLIIQKLKLQVAVRDKLIQRQQAILKDAQMDDAIGYSSYALFEESLSGIRDLSEEGADISVERVLNHPSSPPRTVTAMGREQAQKLQMISPHVANNHSKDKQGDFRNTNGSVESRSSYRDYEMSGEVPADPRKARNDDNPFPFKEGKGDISEPFDMGFAQGEWTSVPENKAGIEGHMLSGNARGDRNQQTPPRDSREAKFAVSSVTSMSKLPMQNKRSVSKAASVDKLPMPGTNNTGNPSTSNVEIIPEQRGDKISQVKNTSKKETPPSRSKPGSITGLGLTSSVPAIFDSPSVGALRTDDGISIISSSSKGNSPLQVNNSAYTQVYQVAFNRPLLTGSSNSSAKVASRVERPENQALNQEESAKKTSRRKQQNNYVRGGDDNESPTTSPRNNNVSPRAGGGSSRQPRNDGLMYGHELDEKSIETVVSEASQGSQMKEKRSMQDNSRSRSVAANNSNTEIRDRNTAQGIGEGTIIERRGREQVTKVHLNNGNAKKSINVNQLQKHQARMRAFRETDKNEDKDRNDKKYLNANQDRAYDSSVERSDESSSKRSTQQKRAQLQRLRNGSKTKRADNIKRVRESVLREQQQYQSMHQQMQQMQQMQARQQQQLMVQRGNYSKADSDKSRNSENQNRNPNPYLEGNPRVDVRQQRPKGLPGSFDAPHGPPGAPPKGQVIAWGDVSLVTVFPPKSLMKSLLKFELLTRSYSHLLHQIIHDF